MHGYRRSRRSEINRPLTGGEPNLYAGLDSWEVDNCWFATNACPKDNPPSLGGTR